MTGKNQDSAVTGSCVCGAISYRAESLQPIWYCHCQQCRKMTGHFMAAAQVTLDQMHISGEPKWFYVSEQSRHGFCPECGSQLFWRNDNNDYMSVTGGSIDGGVDGDKAIGTLLNKGHIFTAEKGAYYEIPANEVQSKTWPSDNASEN